LRLIAMLEKTPITQHRTNANVMRIGLCSTLARAAAANHIPASTLQSIRRDFAKLPFPDARSDYRAERLIGAAEMSQKQRMYSVGKLEPFEKSEIPLHSLHVRYPIRWNARYSVVDSVWSEVARVDALSTGDERVIAIFNAIQGAQLPGKRKNVMGSLFSSAKAKRQQHEEILDGVYTRVLWSVAKNATLDNIFAQAHHTMLETVLAARAYEAANGKLPSAMNQLVPDYLPRPSVNPYTGKPLAVSADGDNLVLTCATGAGKVYATMIGPDAKPPESVSYTIVPVAKQ
jgi:hypothetical protein